MGLSGLVGSGAVKGLEDIITEQLLQAKAAEEQRRAQAQEALQQQRIDQDSAQHEDVMGLNTRAADRMDAQRRDENNRAGVADMMAQRQMMDAQDARAAQDAGMESIAGDTTLPPALQQLAGVVRRSGGAFKPGAIDTGDFADPAAKQNADLAQYEARKKIDLKYTRPTGGDSKQWLLRDGVPVHDAPRPGDTPYDRSRTGERQVLSSDANNIADIDNSIAMLDTLKEGIGATGASSGMSAAMPNWVTETTGIGEDAKKRQAMINGAKQIIGKALEGGVLRKEDEAKYEKILPTLSDDPAVAQSKIEQLRATLEAKRETTLEALGQAGYGVERMRRPASGQPKPASSHGPSIGTERVINGTNAVWDGKGWVAK